MKVRYLLIGILILALIVPGCSVVEDAPAADDPTATADTIATDDNHTEAQPTQPLAMPSPEGNPTEPTYNQTHYGTMEISVLDRGNEWEQREWGEAAHYTGGDMSLPVSIHTTGAVGEKGVGMLLFLDGEPQAYRTDKEPEYAYLHTFYPTAGVNYIANIYFTPKEGKQGETLEMYAASVLEPHHTAAEGTVGFIYTQGSIPIGFELCYDQTPPAEEYPAALPWLTDVTVSYEDSMNSDWIGWSDSDKAEKVESHFYVNGTESTVQYSISGEESVSLRYEIWGTPLVHYGLVIYVDNAPVCGEDGNPIFIDVKEGQKTVVNAELNLPEFDGECVVYAVLVPRNHFSTESNNSAVLTCSRTFFLLEQEKP